MERGRIRRRRRIRNNACRTGTQDDWREKIFIEKNWPSIIINTVENIILARESERG